MHILYSIWAYKVSKVWFLVQFIAMLNAMAADCPARVCVCVERFNLHPAKDGGVTELCIRQHILDGYSVSDNYFASAVPAPVLCTQVCSIHCLCGVWSFVGQLASPRPHRVYLTRPHSDLSGQSKDLCMQGAEATCQAAGDLPDT